MENFNIPPENPEINFENKPINISTNNPSININNQTTNGININNPIINDSAINDEPELLIIPRTPANCPQTLIRRIQEERYKIYNIDTLYLNDCYTVSDAQQKIQHHINNIKLIIEFAEKINNEQNKIITKILLNTDPYLRNLNETYYNPEPKFKTSVWAYYTDGGIIKSKPIGEFIRGQDRFTSHVKRFGGKDRKINEYDEISKRQNEKWLQKEKIRNHSIFQTNHIKEIINEKLKVINSF